MPALRGFAFARCCGSSSASIPHALTGKVGSGSRRFRPRAAAYDSWLPPVGPIRDFHPPPFIHARRTQSPYGLLPIPPRSLSLPTYSCVDPPPPSTLISRSEVSHRCWHRGEPAYPMCTHWAGGGALRPPSNPCAFYFHPPAPAARNTLDSARIPRASKLLICGLFLKGRVLAQDGHKLSVAGRLAIDGETQLKQSPGKPGAVHAMGITVTRVTCLPLSGSPCARYNT